MSDERPDPDSEQTDADDEELSQRDLGPGHPLSPEDSGDPEPADSESGSASEGSGPAGEGFEPDTAERVSADGEESGVSRRGLLFGGAAGVVAASVGWAGVLTLGGDGPGGAEGVAVDYVNAIADNDWAAAGAMFHSESRFGQSDLTYEEYLRGEEGIQQPFERYSSIEPSVENHHTLTHITDPEQASQLEGSGFAFQSGGLDPENIEELKEIVVIASTQPENLNLTEAEREFRGDEPTVIFSGVAVRDDAGWQLVQMFGGTAT